MADQQPPASTEPKPSDAPQAPGSQVPLPVVPGVFSPTTEKQVSDLLAEMQQYASTAAPGTTTTMQFSYQKSKHTTETSGQEPQVVESSHVEKAIHQTPPGGQPQPVEGPPPAQAPAAQAAPAGGILSHIPQFLQEKLGFGGPQQPAPQQPGQQVGQQVGQQIGQQVGQQHTEMSYHHTKKTTTTSSSSTTSSTGGEQQTVIQSQAPSASPAPPAPEPQPQPQPQQQPQQQPQPEEAPAPEGGFFAPLKAAAETIKEQVGHIPEVLQEKFGIGPHAGQEVQQQGGQSQTEISYQHTKKTTTTTSSSTTSGDQQQITSTAHHEAPQPVVAPEEKPSLLEPLKDAAGKVVSGLEHMVEQAAKAFPHPPEGGNVHMEFSKHASRQVVSQSGAEPPQIETTSQGYTQVVQGIFDGHEIIGGVVPVIVTKSITKSGSETDTTSQLSQASVPQVAAPPQQPSAPPSGTTTGTIDASSTSQLEEQLKKLGIQPGHPVTDLLQQTLAQHQRAKTPEANIEIQYSAQRTHSTRTVTYEASGADQKSAHEALQQLQTGLNTVAPPSETIPEPGPAESKPEVKPQESADQPPTQG